MIGRFFLAAVIGLAAMPALAQQSDPRAIMRELGVDLDEKQIAAAIEKASSKRLGSKDNPVRAYRPEGQRAYLARLRCADGNAPAFERVGSVGPGPFASIVDAYAVRCGEAKAIEIYMDMYHDHIETRAVDGFTMAEDAAGPTT
jgi:hypothetical protein